MAKKVPDTPNAALIIIIAVSLMLAPMILLTADKLGERNEKGQQQLLEFKDMACWDVLTDSPEILYTPETRKAYTEMTISCNNAADEEIDMFLEMSCEQIKEEISTRQEFANPKSKNKLQSLAQECENNLR